MRACGTDTHQTRIRGLSVPERDRLRCRCVGALLIFFIPHVSRETARAGRAACVARQLRALARACWSASTTNAVQAGVQFRIEDTSTGCRTSASPTSWASTASRSLLIGLTTLLSVIAIVWSWDTITYRPREYYIAMLLLETGMLGVFMALDLFIFYIFWELMLIPMALLIGVWGSANRVYAAIKFFLYTLAGSLLMLVGIVATYQAYSDQTGDPHAQHPRTADRAGLRAPTATSSRARSSRPSSSPSRSRCRCSRSTPGCRTPTSRRRRRPRSSWRRSC